MSLLFEHYVLLIGFVASACYCCVTVPTDGGTSSSEPCVFPFILNNERFNSCTTKYDSEGKLWCSVETDAEDNHVTGKRRWGHCDESCNTKTKTPPTTAAPKPRPQPAVIPKSEESSINSRGETCTTVGGATKDKPCVFPFTFSGSTFTDCTLVAADDNKPWCSTRVNPRGHHLAGNWGHCECQLIPDQTEQCDATSTGDFRDFTARGDFLPEGECATDGSEFVTGGVDAVVNEFPFAALLEYRIEERIFPACGGSLINRRYVLTAAHCLELFQPESVVLGELDYEKDCDCSTRRQAKECALPVQRFGIDKFVIHREYNPDDSLKNDIALIRLDSPAKIQDNVKPICLASSSTKLLESATVIGWGRVLYNLMGTITDEFVIGSPILQRGSIPLISDETCKERIENDFGVTFQPENQLCGGKNGVDSCKGDSGGPLFIYVGSTSYQIGLVSYGSRRCGDGNPGVYTRVSAYLDWIKDNLEP